jgi:hypothetical protein
MKVKVTSYIDSDIISIIINDFPIYIGSISELTINDILAIIAELKPTDLELLYNQTRR